MENKSQQKKIKQVIKPAYLKIRPERSQIELFKEEFIQLLDRIKNNPKETEEFHKNLIIEFLNATYYRNKFYINTLGHNDLVIHNGDKSSSSVGVLIEVKRPSNKDEMLKEGNFNVKSFQELILYYFRERKTKKNYELRHLIITNINEWYIFDAQDFERLFYNNTRLRKDFEKFEEKILTGTSTNFFYNTIAPQYIKEVEHELSYTYFDIKDYEKNIRNDNKKDDKKLITLYKFLSPTHLLKLPFSKDYNELDKDFYNELLHILGLEETSKGAQKIIVRKSNRDNGSLIENTIFELESRGISKVSNIQQYGTNKDEQLFNIALDLSITWINRILFLKLLEAQIINYKNDKNYSFLSLDKIDGYDDLNSLFFHILAIKEENRRESYITEKFAHVPYLNSSLFEYTELELNTFTISALPDKAKIKLYTRSILKKKKDKNVEDTTLYPLKYLLNFLDAYDFSSEGGEDIQEENRALISASVLGLIFEKINGYKDGSFFTPSFITMYICRDTITKAVLQKFKDRKGWDCKNIIELYNKIDSIEEANDIVNSITICDPSVGSGHFLVSSLNELIYIKSELGILVDRDGKKLRDYKIIVENDELIISDIDGNIFRYDPNSYESQRIQEALFHQKKTLIENCLFGVDINPNSVKICQLRLWIELLKHTYYIKGTNKLETLPNIDINIKTGNSLINRFGLDEKIGNSLRKIGSSVAEYKNAVDRYKNAHDKVEKRELIELINKLKSELKTEVRRQDKTYKTYSETKEELILLESTGLFELNKKQENRKKELKSIVERYRKRIDDVKNNTIYQNAFEWRFEFPEILSDEGDFVGFDVVIGNPPYGVKLSVSERKLIKDTLYNSGETAILFIFKGRKLLKKNGKQSYIIPKAFTYASNYSEIRNTLKEELTLIVDCQKPWQEVKLEACIFQIEKNDKISNYHSLTVKDNEFIKLTETDKSLIDDFGFILNGVTQAEIELAKKIKDSNLFLGDVSTNKRGVGIQQHILPDGLYKVLGGIDIERYKIRETSRGYVNDISSIETIGKLQENSILVQNIVSHITNPVGHIKIIAALPPDEKDKYLILDTINQIIFKESVSARFGCSLLNSKLINWYAYNFIFAKAIRTMHFDNVVTNRIPFPKKYLEQKTSYERDISINDKDIYELFDLNESEISLIESTFKS